MITSDMEGDRGAYRGVTSSDVLSWLPPSQMEEAWVVRCPGRLVSEPCDWNSLSLTRWHLLSVCVYLPLSLSFSLLGSGIRHCILWAGLELKLSEKGVWGPRPHGWLQWLWWLAGAGDATKVWKALCFFILCGFRALRGERRGRPPGPPSGLLAG